MTPTTELSAVNIILDNLGEGRVNSLVGDQPQEATDALNTLRDTSREVQKGGWFFNTEHYSLSPDTDGYIFLPANTLKVSSTYSSGHIPVIQRGDKLYNMTPFNTGFVFTAAVYVELVLGLDFDVLPQTARSYITFRAGRVAQINITGDQVSAQEDSQEEQNALVELRQEEASSAPLSLRNNPDVQGIAHSAGHYGSRNVLS